MHLVENLQQLARADAAKAYLKREDLVLQELVQQMIKLHEPNFSEKKITVAIDSDEPEAVVAVDRDKMLQALRNLVENCWRYTPESGEVTVKIVHVDYGVRVVFQNSGPGITAVDLPYIFERFFRADRSRSRDGGGAGIGLAITRELIEAHGGQVGAESDSKITSIWFTLPVHPG